MKVVINCCFGGFGLSQEAQDELIKLGVPSSYSIWLDGKNVPQADWRDLPRHDERLVKVVESLGQERAGTRFSNLRVVSIEDQPYEIDEYDGSERILKADSEIRWS